MSPNRGATSADRVAESWSTASRRDLRPRHTFPLVRHISWRVTLLLCRTPITPNQISVIGPIVGLIGVSLYIQDGLINRLLGVAGFFFLYLCDHCDGELARLTRRESKLGDRLSEIGGASFHAGLFLGIGWKASVDFGNRLSDWLALFARQQFSEIVLILPQGSGESANHFCPRVEAQCLPGPHGTSGCGDCALDRTGGVC